MQKELQFDTYLGFKPFHAKHLRLSLKRNFANLKFRLVFNGTSLLVMVENAGKADIMQFRAFIEGFLAARELLVDDVEEMIENPDAQFPRLIAEAEAAGAFNDEVVDRLVEEMDLDPSQIGGIIEMAQNIYELNKQELA